MSVGFCAARWPSNTLIILLILLVCSPAAMSSTGVNPAAVNVLGGQESTTESSTSLTLAALDANNALVSDSLSTLSAEAGYQVVDVGVLAIRGYKSTVNRWQPLMGWLESQIPNSYFRLHPLSIEELAKGVETEALDFVITNPGQSVMLARQFSLSWLATLRSPINNGAAMQVGSALVVRADSPYQT